MFAQNHDIRRHALDSSFKIDFYRQSSLTERRAVMTDFFTGMKKFGKPLVGVAIVALAVYMAPARDGAGWNGPTVPGTGTNNASLVNLAKVTR